MKQYGLIGHPLTHSFSKRYFTEKFIAEGINDCHFENYDLDSINDFKTLLNNNPTLHGLCVTIPYKQEVIQFLDHVDFAVQTIGACNSIHFKEGKLYGYNTDTLGFEKALKEKIKPIHDKALILGTGGASKAVAYVLNNMQIPFKTVSRKPSEINEINYDQLSAEVMEEHRLIINTTPLGMYPNVASCPSIPYSYLTKDHFLFDLVYNPEETVFLQKGKAFNAQISNGYHMLIYQAEASWKIWNDLK